MMLIHLCCLVLKSRTMAWRKTKHYSLRAGCLFSASMQRSPQRPRAGNEPMKISGKRQPRCVLSVGVSKSTPFWGALALWVGPCDWGHIFSYCLGRRRKNVVLPFSTGFDSIIFNPWTSTLSLLDYVESGNCKPQLEILFKTLPLYR